MSSIGFPYLPVSQMVECCLGPKKFEQDLQMTRWTKIPTQHLFAIYNGTAVVANTSLFAMVTVVVAVAFSYLHPVWGVIAFTVSLWTHISARIDCVSLIPKMREILAEVNPVFARQWNPKCECHQFLYDILRPIPQSLLDVEPYSFSMFRLKVRMRDWELSSEIKRAWLGVHERNRPALREFFDTQAAAYIGEDPGSFMQTLCKKCLLEEGVREFFVVPRTRLEINEFLNQRCDGENSECSSQSGELERAD